MRSYLQSLPVLAKPTFSDQETWLAQEAGFAYTDEKYSTLQEQRMPTVNDIAKFFLQRANQEDDTAISNLKLQKLLYYAQAFHLALFDRPLFEDDFFAWMHGPVCPVIYHQYKQFGANPIPFENKEPSLELSPEQLELLEEINDQFGQYSAWKLRNMTHEEAPWKAAEATGGIISKASMQEFYKTRLK